MIPTFVWHYHICTYSQWHAACFDGFFHTRDRSENEEADIHFLQQIFVVIPDNTMRPFSITSNMYVLMLLRVFTVWFFFQGRIE